MELDLDCTQALDGGMPLAMVVVAGRPLVAVEGGGLRWVDPRRGPVELALGLPVASAADGRSLAGVHPAIERAVRVVDAQLEPVRDVHLPFAPAAVAIGAGGAPVAAGSASGEIEVEGAPRWSAGRTRIDGAGGSGRSSRREGSSMSRGLLGARPPSTIAQLAIAPDGARVAGTGGAGAFAARLDGSALVRLDVAGAPSAMAWSTAHGLWAYEDGVGLVRLDVDDGTSSRLELEGWTKTTRAHAFSPDGTRLLVSDGRDAWVVDTGRGRRLCSVRTSDPGARLICGALDADDTVGWALFEREGSRRLARFDQA